MEMQMEFIRKLPNPQDLKEEFPVTDDIRRAKEERDREIADILTGKSDKFLLIIGPCSADREDAVLDYMNRLAKVQEKVKDKLFFIPRVYTNKPRTKGIGYKGMLHQPDPEKEEDMLAGIIAIRQWPGRPALPVPRRCCIRKTTAIFPICLVMSPSVHGPWRTSSTVSWQAASEYRRD